jgi:hypothetical protein
VRFTEIKFDPPTEPQKRTGLQVFIYRNQQRSSNWAPVEFLDQALHRSIMGAKTGGRDEPRIPSNRRNRTLNPRYPTTNNK